MPEMKITVTPAKIDFAKKKAAIYARVSTMSDSQENSLENQIGYFEEMISRKFFWEHAGTYTDKSSGKNIQNRPGFQRMIDDAFDRKIDIIVTKSISRFGRNTVDTLDTLNKLRIQGVDVYFDIENIWLKDTSTSLILSLMAGIAQAQSFERSENIRWGIEKKIKDGTSHLYKRKCYGYTHDENGQLVITEEQAAVVRLIFDLYIAGHGIISIIRVLAEQGIESPQGSERWSKRAIETMLDNEKYIGNVVVGKTYTKGEYPMTSRHINRGEKGQYRMSDSHEGIISIEQWAAVQAERARRSNVEIVAGVRKRKNTHYSCKENKDDIT